MCTRAVCGLAHFLESEGITTIVLGLVPHHVRAMSPPRALLVPFELGRPLGAPHNVSMQKDVIAAALGLLDHPGPGPVVDTLEIEATPASAEEAPWVCPVSFPAPSTSGNDLSDAVAAEVRLLQPWFDRAYRQRGHTAADVSGMELASLVTWLGRFLKSPAPSESPVPGSTLAESFKLGVEDLKTFYLEAITAQPGAPSSSEIDGWFWQDTAAGTLLWKLRDALWEHPDSGVRLHARFTLVPAAQVNRRQ